jgi:hypothetical protein
MESTEYDMARILECDPVMQGVGPIKLLHIEDEIHPS